MNICIYREKEIHAYIYIYIYIEREASEKYVERDLCIRLDHDFSWIPLQLHLPAPGHPAFHDLIISILD